MRPLSVSPRAVVYVASASAASKYGSMPGRFRADLHQVGVLAKHGLDHREKPEDGHVAGDPVHGQAPRLGADHQRIVLGQGHKVV